MTRSPGFTCFTFPPTAVTQPTHSAPGVAGSGGFRRYVPLQKPMSAGLIGKASTSNTTSSAAGAPTSGTSAQRATPWNAILLDEHLFQGRAGGQGIYRRPAADALSYRGGHPRGGRAACALLRRKPRHSASVPAPGRRLGGPWRPSGCGRHGGRSALSRPRTKALASAHSCLSRPTAAAWPAMRPDNICRSASSPPAGPSRPCAPIRCQTRPTDAAIESALNGRGRAVSRTGCTIVCVPATKSRC